MIVKRSIQTLVRFMMCLDRPFAVLVWIQETRPLLLGVNSLRENKTFLIPYTRLKGRKNLRDFKEAKQAFVYDKNAECRGLSLSSNLFLNPRSVSKKGGMIL